MVINDKTLLTRGQRKNKSEEQNHHNKVLGRRQPMPTQQKCGFSSGKSFGPIPPESQNPLGKHSEVNLSLFYKALEQLYAAKKTNTLLRDWLQAIPCAQPPLSLVIWLFPHPPRFTLQDPKVSQDTLKWETPNPPHICSAVTQGNIYICK